MTFLMGAPFMGNRAGPAGSLDGLQWFLPKTGDAGGGSWTTVATDSDSAIMGGTPGVIYLVTLRIQGTVELRAYSGGTNDGAHWQIGGFAGGGWNAYSLRVNNPQVLDPERGAGLFDQLYYLNRWTSNVGNPVDIDYVKTIAIATGATVSLLAESGDGIEGPGGSLNGVDGQNITMTVLGVVPQ